MRVLAVTLVVGLLVAVTVFNVPPKWILAPLLGMFVYKVGTASLRSMAARTNEPSVPEPVVGAGERTLYWCEQCGTELLLVIRGSGLPPRHCGERMHARVEQPN